MGIASNALSGFFLASLSGLVFAAEPEKLSVPAFMVRFQEGFAISNAHVISNMPRETNQFGMGMCYAHAATGVLNYYLCKHDKLDCAKAPPENLASTLDMARFGAKADDGAIEYSSSYQGFQEGGSPSKVLEAATVLVGDVASQACFNEKMIFGDLIIEDKMPTDEEVEKQRKVLADLSSFYDKYHPVGFDADSLPDAVVAEALKMYQASDVDLKGTRRRVAASLGEDSFDRFFARFVYPRNCVRAKNRVYFEYKNQAKFHFYPGNGERFTYKGMMREIKAAINKGNPVVAGGACVWGLKGKKCPGELHAMIIYGYATLCDPAGNCYDGLKFQNSFGPQMEKFEHANWFAADEFYSQLIPSKSEIGWVEIGLPQK
ncbi:MULTISPECIES: hypothetical protein [Pseudomonas]|uniref:hypothetical protein n=1 Tax=Pseudomonas nitroreducens TaxID=46680 RepID=UPI001E40C9B2|nr:MULTISPECIES: hypothetical protein [Pseudomonas]MCE4071448.1 hypothetical protein [Pseudomonas nitritireducens]MCE4081224.1 hypothetical protein [Pseudomonas nitroreducens]